MASFLFQNCSKVGNPSWKNKLYKKFRNLHEKNTKIDDIIDPGLEIQMFPGYKRDTLLLIHGDRNLGYQTREDARKSL